MTSTSASQSPDDQLASREISEAWLEMHGADYGREFAARVKIPDMSGLVSEEYIKAVLPAFTELSKSMSSLAAAAFPTHLLKSMQQLFVKTAGLEMISKTFIEGYAEIMKPLIQSINALDIAPYGEFQKTIASMASSMTAAIDTSQIQDLLASASALRHELADEDIDELTDEFFWSHPNLAESIEEIPALRALSKSERNLVIWYVRICVAMTFTCILLNINMENPQLDAVLGAVGISGGWQAGKSAGGHAGRALDKLEKAKSE